MHSLAVGVIWFFRHSGSVIMSAVYSYEAARRRDHMIERAALGLEIILKEMRPEVAAIFSAFPTRTWSRCPSYPTVADYLICSSPPPVLVAWHASQESFTFGQAVGGRKPGKSICAYRAWSGK